MRKVIAIALSVCVAVTFTVVLQTSTVDAAGGKKINVITGVYSGKVSKDNCVESIKYNKNGQIIKDKSHTGVCSFSVFKYKKGKLVSKVSYSDGYKYTTKYKCNKNYLVVKETEDGDLTTYKYNKKKLLTKKTKKTYEGKKVIGVDTTTYKYNKKKLPIKVTRKSKWSNSVDVDIHTYKYDKRGNVIKEKIVYKEGKKVVDTYACTYKHTYKKGKLIKTIVYRDYSGYKDKKTITYTSKKVRVPKKLVRFVVEQQRELIKDAPEGEF